MKKKFIIPSDLPKKMPKKMPDKAIWFLFAKRGWIYLGNFIWVMRNGKKKFVPDPAKYAKGF